MSKIIDNIVDFSKFLNDNDLVYAGSASNPFSKLSINGIRLEGFVTIAMVENKYNVKLELLYNTL